MLPMRSFPTTLSRSRARGLGRLALLLLVLGILAGGLAGCGRSRDEDASTPAAGPGGTSAQASAETSAPSPAEDTRPPQVTLSIQAPPVIHPGDLVLMLVEATDPDGPVTDYRLAIDGVDSGWRSLNPETEEHFGYEWTAGEPGTYQVVAQARDQAGNLGQAQEILEVKPRPTPQPTPQPTTPPTATPTPEGQAGQAVARILHRMNVRSGPGVEYALAAVVQAGEQYPILGRDSSGQWLQIRLGPGREPGWLFAPAVQAENADQLPVVAVTTPAGEATPTPAPVDLAPAPAPVGTVTVYETSVTLPTYPYERYQTDAVDPAFNWPYKRFDWERFQADRPAPEERSYRLLVLENDYLRISILPELGGRIWEVVHKPTGADMFYRNPVVKPSPWGPGEQRGWLALGGLEWDLPVVEHGYAWGEEWGHLPLQHSPELASVTVFTPRDGRWLNASVTVSLHAGAASFQIEPTITNLGPQALEFAYWQTALLAPGGGNKPTDQLRFLLPGDQMTVHSTEDPRLPEPGQPFDWPVYNGVDFSWLGNWGTFLGFFERPAAHGPFAGVYDGGYDGGAVRVFPADVARGSKAFGLGWQQPLDSRLYTDDGSGYVELHGGLAPTFAQGYELPPGGSVTWREVWYPVQGIAGLTYADEVAALHLRPGPGGLEAGLYPTRPMDGVLVLSAQAGELTRQPVKASPDAPFNGLLASEDALPAKGPVTIEFQDSQGHPLFRYSYTGPLR